MVASYALSPSVGFGRVPPYRMACLRYQAQSFVQNIRRRVHVSVMDGSAHWANPLPDGQVLCPRPLSAAGRTQLRGREVAAYRDHGFPVPFGFVFQLPTELAPTCVGYRASKFMVLHHVLGSQVLNGNEVIVPHKFSRQLVEHIAPLVLDVLMKPGNPKPCSLPAVAPLCFSGEPALEFCKFLCGLGEILMVGIFHPIGGDCEEFDPHVKANNGPGGGQGLNFHVRTAQGNEIFPAGIPAYGGRQDATFDCFGDTAFYKTELGELHGFIQHFDVRPYAFALVALPVVVLAFESGIAGLLPGLHPAEEILIGGIQIPQGRLQGGSVYFPHPLQRLLELGHASGAFIVIQRLTLLLIGFFPMGEIVVPDKAATAKRSLNLLRLCGVGIDTKFVAVFHLLTSHGFTYL